jgi:hypothetical protein
MQKSKGKTRQIIMKYFETMRKSDIESPVKE